MESQHHAINNRPACPTLPFDQFAALVTNTKAASGTHTKVPDCRALWAAREMLMTVAKNMLPFFKERVTSVAAPDTLC